MVDGAAPAAAPVEGGAALLDGRQIDDLVELDQPVVAVFVLQVSVDVSADPGQDERPVVKDDKRGVRG
jgi:hypothetical protein